MIRMLSRLSLPWRGCLVLSLVSLVFLVSISVAAARGWLGVSVQDITQELREAMNLVPRSGALISDVVSDSPADEADLRTGDVIVRIGDQVVEDAEDLVEMISERRSGEQVLLTLFRGEEELEIDATLRDREETDSDRWLEPLSDLRESFKWIPRLDQPRGFRLGVEIYALDNRDLARYFRTEPGRGVVVLRVLRDSPAEEAGIRPGDVLLRVNDTAISSAEDLREELGRLDPGDEWSIAGLREGREAEWNGETGQDWDPGVERRELRELEREPRTRKMPVWTHRQIRRFEREVRELRGRIKDLERRLDALRDR